MYAPVFSAQLPARIVFLTARESGTGTDLSVLRSLGIRSVNHQFSGSECLAFLEKTAASVSIPTAERTRENRTLSFSANTAAAPSSASSAGEGVAAVVPFTGTPAEALLCGERFEDMPVLEFLQLLAAHPKLHSFPVVVFTGSRELGKAFSSAGIQTLVRPYSPSDLSAALRRALSAMRRPLDGNALKALAALALPGQGPKRSAGEAGRMSGAGGTAGAFGDRKAPAGSKAAAISQAGTRPQATTGAEAGAHTVRRAAARPRTVGDIFAAGMESLRRNDIREAESAFMDVLAQQEDHVEAALAVAKIHRSQGDARAMRRFLLRAAAAALRQGDSLRSASVAALLPEHMRGSIYVHEAAARMEEGNYRAAALGFLDACKEQRRPALHTVIARACQLTDAPEASLRKLCEAYTRLGYEPAARQLASRLLGGADVRRDERPSWLDSFPLLRDALEVASYTTRAWKHA